MIESARATEGFAAALPALSGRTFAFGPGLNLLFGPNGIGKSTLLRLAGAYAGCAQSGWSTAAGGDDTIPYPARFRRLAPKGCAAEVAWDGAPALMARLDALPAHGFSDREEEFAEQIDALVNAPSSGEAVLGRISALARALRAPPDLSLVERTWDVDGHRYLPSSVNDQWAQKVGDFVAYVSTLPRRGPMTVLLDEPDRSLSIPNQQALWARSLPGLARHCQVIVATHSPFALAAPGPVTVVEFEPGYVESCRAAVRALAAAG